MTASKSYPAPSSGFVRLAAACANSLIHLSLPWGTTDRGYVATLGGAMRDARGGGHPLVESIIVGHNDLLSSSTEFSLRDGEWAATAGALAGLGASFPELKSVSIQHLVGLEEPELDTTQHWCAAHRLAELHISKIGGSAYGPSDLTSAQLRAFIAGVCSSFTNLEVLDLNSGASSYTYSRSPPALGPGLGGIATSLPRLRSLTLRNIGIAAADGGGGAGGGGASSSSAAAAPSAVGLLPPSLTSLSLVSCGGFAAGACSFIEPAFISLARSFV